MTQEKIPKVFVSYSHDSQAHKQWVLNLATRLRNTGVDAIIDQWELKPGDDLPHFMETNLAIANYVLMICTDNYVAKANTGAGGVGYEKMIVTSSLLAKIDSNKIIPIIRQNGGAAVPTFLGSKIYLNFSSDDEFEFSYDELIRTIHKSPLFIKPKIANNPFTPVAEIPLEKAGDATRNLMALVIQNFEAGRDFYNYRQLIKDIGISRILLDKLIAEVINAGLISQDSDGDVRVLTKGKEYALLHKLIS